MADHLSDMNRQKGYGGYFPETKSKCLCTLNSSCFRLKKAKTESEGEFEPRRWSYEAIAVDFLWGS